MGMQAGMNKRAYNFLLDRGKRGATFDEIADELYSGIPVFVISRVARTLNGLLSRNKIQRRQDRYYATPDDKQDII